MKTIIKYLKSGINFNKYTQGNRVSILMEPLFLLSFIVAVIIIVPNFYLMNIKWWIKFFIGFSISFIITIKINTKMDFNYYILNVIKIFIWRMIVFVILWICLGIYFDLNTIYCDDTDDDTSNDNNNNNNNSKDTNDKSYLYSGSVDKGIIKEAVQGVVEGIGNIVPVVVGGIAGAGLGGAIIKSTSGLPPLQKAALGVATAIGGSLGVSVSSAVGKEIAKNIINTHENVTDSSDKIASILEFGDNMSPLQALLNYEIVICLLILFHIVILILILLNKVYVSGSLKVISKIIPKQILDKYDKYKVMIEQISNKFLIILFIINVIFLLGYILLLIYINFEISSHLDDYINVHSKMKKIISILLVNCKMNEINSDNKIISLLNIKCFSNSSKINSIDKLESKSKLDTKNIMNILPSLPNLSDNLINKGVLIELDKITNKNRIEFKELDEKFYNLVIYLIISKNHMTKKKYLELFNYLIANLNELGIQVSYFKEIKNILKYESKSTKSKQKKDMDKWNEDNPIFNKYFDLYLEISKFYEKRKGRIKLKYWNEFINSLNSFDQFNDSKLNNISIKIINKIKTEYKDLVENEQFKEVWSRKYAHSTVKPKKEWSDYQYQKEMDNCLKRSIYTLKKEQIDWLTNTNNELLNDFSNLTDIIKEFIKQISFEISVLIYDLGYVSESYTNNPKIQYKVKEKDEENRNLMLIKNRKSELNLLINHLNKIQLMETSKDKINKWSGINITIFNTIDDILESNISNEEKQIAVEKAIFEYDNNFFRVNMNIISNEIKIFSQEYMNISNNYLNHINEYTQYRSTKLKMLFKNDRINAIIILMLIYMGKDKTISLVFKFILDKILFNNQNNEGINKTNLLFMVGKYFTKIFMLSECTNVLNSVKNICTYIELKDYITKFNDIDYMNLGENLYYLVEKGSNLIEKKLINHSLSNREIIVKINPIYINKVISSNISLSLLPMVSHPKKIDKKGEYYPYYLNNTNVLALDECLVIKGKYDQRYYAQASEQFYEGINYINNIKFKINKDMLNIVLNEWDKSDSILFKGYNISKEINPNDKHEIKIEKLKHNAKYSLYYNIIHIAYLFRNQTFYLPVYADFRGRIYTLSNYLSYQGNDLARALLLFDSNETLNDKGLECLNIYLTNLAGYDKLSWNDRIDKSNIITEQFLDAALEYLNNESNFKIKNLILNISEPFQFISIGLAKLDYLKATEENNKCIIRNPILFDASCSGIQHISALTLDTNLAKYTNVITDKENPSKEIPEDFYSYALELINEKLRNSDNPNIQKIKLTRKIIKRTVMTIPYNISLNGTGKQLEEHFKKIWVLKNYEFLIPENISVDGLSFTITSKDFGLLSKLVYNVLTTDIPSLKKLTNYFKKIINILNLINIPITWETPAGLKMRFQQIKFESKLIKNKLIKTSKPITISIPTDKIDKIKMLRSFMPNFIHSLDASNVHLLLKNLSINNKIPLYTIHDCFASTPNNIELLDLKVKEAFIEIYFKDKGYLLKSHNKIITQIKETCEIFIENGKECIEIYTNKNDKVYVELPQLPKAFQNNNLNEFIKGLLQSKYFIG